MGLGALWAGESGGKGENGARGLSGMGEMPGHTIGELIGSGEQRVGGAKPPNGLPVLMKLSWGPKVFTAASSSLSSSSIEMGILRTVLAAPYITGGLLALGTVAAAGTRRSKSGGFAASFFPG